MSTLLPETRPMTDSKCHDWGSSFQLAAQECGSGRREGGRRGDVQVTRLSYSLTSSHSSTFLANPGPFQLQPRSHHSDLLFAQNISL